MYKPLRYVFLLFTIVAAGCATIIDGSTEKVTLTSEPEGATVSMNGAVLGKTPLNINLDKENDPTLTFEAEGYKTLTTTFSSSLNPLVAGNIVIGGLFGTTTDAASGALYQYDENHFYAELVPESSDGMTIPSERVNAKAFIIGNAVDIRVLSAEGVIELELKDLLTILEVPEESRTEATVLISKLSKAFPDDVEFADAVLSELNQ